MGDSITDSWDDPIYGGLHPNAKGYAAIAPLAAAAIATSLKHH